MSEITNEKIIEILTQRLEEATAPKLKPVTNDEPPSGMRVLLFWGRSGHMEDGEIYRPKDGAPYHVLFDGNRINDEPTHYMQCPKVKP